MRKLIGLFWLLLAIITGISLYYLGTDGVKTPSLPANSENQAPQTSPTASEPGFIKAVHYFSSSWPISFWEDFENSQVERDLEQIKADGFNTVILVVPWMGFETGFETGQPEPSSLYQRLSWLITKVDQAGLDYGIRVSFPHSFDPAVGTVNNALCTEIFVNNSVRDNWHRYLERISAEVDKHRDSFKFAFFSWEDFFCPYVLIPGLDGNLRMDIARRSGYQTWLEQHYPKALVERSYGQPFDTMKSVPVPERESPAFWLFLRFVDHFLIEHLIIPGRNILPELAMEVRVDKDLIHDGEDSFWAEHDLALTDKQIRGSYWGAYNGARNEGESLSAREALRNFEYMLNEVSDNGNNINHIVEQFNFVDNTPAYAGHHARIEPAEIPAFLEGSAKLLKQKSRGYGLWAYRDYADSSIYNASFELGLRGWDVTGTAEVITNMDGDKALRLQPGAEISQTFAPYERFIGLTPSKEITFCAHVAQLAKPAHLSLALNYSEIGRLELNEPGKACTVMDSQAFKQLQIRFSITSDTQVQLDDLRLFSYVHELGVYDEDGDPGVLRDLIVRLNNEWLND